jgi:hypothetical protein
MMCREIIAVHCMQHAEHMITVCEQQIQYLKGTDDSAYSYFCGVKG